ncbi:hypothetical protein CHLNCDRAFT_133961 [Chlorella variabilis]|uniref:Oxidoreductase n=1 Tax=Chlorella variabilis TaxID=554065 RepID=E1ZEN6_CHLVA|nr:hypothetical protein CHLNCDRAFT_133961 [Chlorella variabilis]EFN55527.1 hypothetical protein CHLNCDRAFT_133961 [Chlorella variabilis]|eukprot:XP_005847629.1 hypothetical protein CHLNCDRAFT_133961 [Chlorella variabilis]
MSAAAPLPRTAVVTGTARPTGIGRACARAFLRAGYRVLGVDKLKLQDTDPDEALGPHYAHVVIDVAAPAEVGFVPTACRQQFGSADVHALINKRQRRRCSTGGAFLMSQAVLPHMPAGDAAIIHISSTRAHQSEPHSEAYAAAKAGMLGLTHAQAVSLAHRVRVNAVLPGWIDTSGEPASITPADHAWHPAGRVGWPEDVAELCLFLADSSRAGFITGQEFVVDGGLSKKMVYPEEELEQQQQQQQQPETAARGQAQQAAAEDEEQPPMVWPE